MSALLAFNDVSFGYGPRGSAVLEHLSLAIEPGTATAILGPNGAGKSTLLQLATGWLRPRGGQVLLDGQPMQGLPRRLLGRSVSLVPQGEHAPFDYSVLEYVLLARAPHLAPLAMPGPEDERTALAAIRDVGLGRLAHRAVTTLSGGERQLALVARALAQEPRLLLLDEPTSQLDLAHKAQLVRLLRELLARGITLLAATHEPDVAAALATHLVLMREGCVYRAGDFAEVFTPELLSATYGVPVRIACVDGRQVVVWS
ncbi:MAG: ABC transporter ATP-binding protein [Candidatus Limnocylindrales bacterium]